MRRENEPETERGRHMLVTDDRLLDVGHTNLMCVCVQSNGEIIVLFYFPKNVGFLSCQGFPVISSSQQLRHTPWTAQTSIK